jgi:CHAT domain-containing protein
MAVRNRLGGTILRQQVAGFDAGRGYSRLPDSARRRSSPVPLGAILLYDDLPATRVPMEACLRRCGPLAGSVLCLIFASSFAISAAAQDAAQSQNVPSLQTQITQHEQLLAAARASQLQAGEALELNTLASLYRQVGKRQQGVDYCNEALAIERAAGNRLGEAASLTMLGRILTDMGQEQKAMDLFNQVLPIWREFGNRLGEATTLTNIGRVYNDLGKREDALRYLNQSLPIWREIKSSAGEASALDIIGTAYSYMGHAPEALDNYNQALPLWRKAAERGGEALTLGNMAIVYDNLGEEQRSLDFYRQALVAWREVGNRPGEARALNFMGRVYKNLGQKQKALEIYNQALPIWREVGNPSGEGLALNDIGRVYYELGQNKKALDFYNQALPLWRQAGNRRGEAATLTNTGRSYSSLGQQSRALQLDYESLVAWRDVEDRRGEAFALSSIGNVYTLMGQQQRALPIKLAALSLAKDAGDPDLQGAIETRLMADFRAQNRSEEAIFFGTQAVNSFQQIRKNITGLDEELQTGFAQSKSSTYRELAELLVQADRLGEAEQVLDLLKEQELKEVVRGEAETAEAKVEPLPLTDAQQKAQSDLAASEQTGLAVTDMSVEYAGLLTKATRTPEEAARLKTLEMNLEAQNGEVSDFFKKTLYPELAKQAGTQNANTLLSSEKSEVSRLQNTLMELGPHVMGIRLLLGDDHAYAIAVTARARKKFELKATPVELRRKVLQVRDDLRNPSSDPKPHLAELYAMVVAPFDAELSALERNSQDKLHVPTLLWSLDGAMRYLPMAALYDGQRYLAERFNNVLFTPESYGHMAAPPDVDRSSSLRVLAMGLSKSYGGLPALPGVLPELDAVVHDPSVPESHGPMDGVLLPNERFTYAALESELGTGTTFPVVHIASHFVLEYGSGDEPYLMLGGESSGDPQGYQLTLSKLEDSTISFHGTHLLTLSACSTAKGDVANDGLEMDSLGMVAQQKDAEAVLATLWDVNDASTSRIMSDFYARWAKNPAAGKAEALRQAQLALLRRGGDRAVQTAGASSASATTHDADYSHPFYWAPFVLIGNYQ